MRLTGAVRVVCARPVCGRRSNRNPIRRPHGPDYRRWESTTRSFAVTFCNSAPSPAHWRLQGTVITLEHIRQIPGMVGIDRPDGPAAAAARTATPGSLPRSQRWYDRGVQLECWHQHQHRSQVPRQQLLTWIVHRWAPRQASGLRPPQKAPRGPARQSILGRGRNQPISLFCAISPTLFCSSESVCPSGSTQMVRYFGLLTPELYTTHQQNVR